MARELIDLLWRDHPLAPKGGARGPRAKVTTSQAVDVALALADVEGLDAVTVRRLAAELGISGMAVYTHVGSVTISWCSWSTPCAATVRACRTGT